CGGAPGVGRGGGGGGAAGGAGLEGVEKLLPAPSPARTRRSGTPACFASYAVASPGRACYRSWLRVVLVGLCHVVAFAVSQGAVDRRGKRKAGERRPPAGG